MRGHTAIDGDRDFYDRYEWRVFGHVKRHREVELMSLYAYANRECKSFANDCRHRYLGDIYILLHKKQWFV